MKKQLEINDEYYIVEEKDGKFIISKKSGTADPEDAIVALRAYLDGEGGEIK